MSVFERISSKSPFPQLSSPSSAGLYSLRQSATPKPGSDVAAQDALESRVKGWEMGFLQFS